MDFERRPVRSTFLGISLGWLIAILVTVLVGAIAVGIWFFRVETSDTKGRGDAEIIKNSAPNRIGANKTFEELFADIEAADKNINTTAEALALNPNDSKLSRELLGQKQFCNNLVAEYNADARAFLTEQFRAADLPHQIDDSKPNTDCKENKK